MILYHYNNITYVHIMLIQLSECCHLLTGLAVRPPLSAQYWLTYHCD